METFTLRIAEHVVEGKRLGRHVEHDPRSRNYAYEPDRTGVLVAVSHKRHGGIFNQLRLGSCTGNAACGAKNTEPLYHSGSTHLIAEAGAVDVYSLATRLDGLTNGYYPPDDPGSSGLAAAKAMHSSGRSPRGRSSSTRGATSRSWPPDDRK